MNILLDTTIQINRLFKPKDREIIKHIIDHNDCYCSTYVLGEFKANIVRDFVTLHSIMQIEENLTEVYQRIAEVYSARQKTRLLYIVNDLARLYDEDFDLISVKNVQDYLSLESVQSVYYWLNGRNIPTIDNLYALSELLQVPIDAMICGNRKVWFDKIEDNHTARLIIYYGEINYYFREQRGKVKLA